MRPVPILDGHKEAAALASRHTGSASRLRRAARHLSVLGLALATSACSGSGLFGPTAPPPGVAGPVRGFQGAVVADEPRAALIGRQVLAEGGDAADAAVAMGFALSVTLPSRAGLGGAGACLAFTPGAKNANKGVPEAVLFTPAAPPGAAGGDRPAALPMLPRGLYLLHAKFGHLPFAALVAPAEELARLGTPASAALVRDLDVVATPLLADPQARAVFSRNGQPLRVGDLLSQPALAATLARMRVAGVGDFYQGGLAQTLAQQSPLAGGPLPAAALRGALPTLAQPIVVADGNDRVAFLPPPADGGLAAAAAFETLRHDPTALQAAAERALAVAAAWRRGGTSAQALLAGTPPPGALPPLPASTTFLALDRAGGAVACAVTMDNLFGTGRIVPGMGFLLAASPASVPPPLLAAAMAWNPNTHAFRAAVAGSGQNGAALAAAMAMANTLRTGQAMPTPVPEPGRADAIACSRYLPGDNGSCGWATDPRGNGLAQGGG